jgi:IclR family acetate operon transcriptional repressor
LTRAAETVIYLLVEHEFQIDGPSPPGTQVIDRAAGVLRHVLESEQPIGLTDLALAAELPKSTTSRLLGALERNGLVRRTTPRGPFAPGATILSFAQRGLIQRNLVELAQDALQALSDASGETINLAVPAPDGVEHIAQVDSRHFLGSGQWLGRAVDLHATGTGKVFLAFAAATLPSGALVAHTPETIVERGRLESELATVRRRGLATAIDELEPGLAAIAAPVRTQGGDVVAALSVSGPTMRLDTRRVRELEAPLIQQARALSGRLGHHDADKDAA